MGELPEYIDGLPNICGSEQRIEEAIRARGTDPVFLPPGATGFNLPVERRCGTGERPLSSTTWTKQTSVAVAAVIIRAAAAASGSTPGPLDAA